MAIQIRDICPLLQVFDMPTSIKFYRDVLGFAVAQTSAPDDSFTWALLSRDGAQIMLNTAYEDDERPAAPDPGRMAGHADAALFFGCLDLDGAYRHLRAHGIDVTEPVVRDYGMKQLYVRDPDGFELCFQSPVA
jgi:catechol 2,3-dioxygenase-like lactoylglutathione lyase family enzyme